MKKNIYKKINNTNLGFSFEEDLKKRLKNPNFQAAWNEQTGDLYLDIALEIISARRRKRLSQKELAQKMGTSQQAIARLESPNYKGYSIKSLERIANVLEEKLDVALKPKSQQTKVINVSITINNIDSKDADVNKRDYFNNDLYDEINLSNYDSNIINKNQKVAEA